MEPSSTRSFLRALSGEDVGHPVVALVARDFVERPFVRSIEISTVHGFTNTVGSSIVA
jgi:hypothetical protein